MGNELVRNGGFERGDTEFWEVLNGTIDIETVEKKRGSYCCKAIGGGVLDLLDFQSKDYIKVSVGEIYKVQDWIQGGKAARTMDLSIRFYDTDLDLISYISMFPLTTPAAWSLRAGYFVIPEECSYIKIYEQGFGTIAAPLYIDSVSLQRIDIDKLAVCSEELINILNETAKYTVAGPKFFTGIWKEAEYVFNLTSFTETGGANPVTIDVKIQTYDPETATWDDAMVFQQKSCAASGSVTTREKKMLVGNLGWKQRVMYTTAGAGTIGDCDFKVGVVYKR